MTFEMVILIALGLASIAFGTYLKLNQHIIGIPLDWTELDIDGYIKCGAPILIGIFLIVSAFFI